MPASTAIDNNVNNDNDLEQPLLERNEENASTPEATTSTPSSEEAPLPSLYRFVMLGKPEFRMLGIACLLMIYNQVSQLILPQMVGHAYDDLVDPEVTDKMSRINRIMLQVLLIHCSGAMAGGCRTALMGIAGERIVARLRTSLYSSILKQEIAFFDATKSGELVSRLGSDTTVVKRAISSSWAEVLLGFVRLIAAISLMFWISGKLAAVTLGSTFAIFMLCLPFGRYLGKLSKMYQDTLGEAQNYPTETIGAMRTVQSFAAEEREAKRYASKIGTPCYWPERDEQSTFKLGFDQSTVRACFQLLIFGGGFGAMYVTLWYGFALVHKGDITLGQLTAFQSYIFQIGGILAHMSSSISNVIEARGTSQRIFALLDRKPKIPTTTTSTTTPSNAPADVEEGAPNTNWNGKLDGMVAFEDVTFTYPTRPGAPVLKKFSLNIPKGQTTAIVGPSGAGKSTLISLLERFYDVDSGSILFSGHDIRSMDLKTLRRQIGYVQQEPTLFGLSLRDNISYGLENESSLTDEQIMEACRKANAHEFIAQFPEGLDEMVGERGVKLSGGQKQRIAIARAILLNPAVLLLDEATSALDAESEFLVQQAIDAASEGRTTIVVAHRLSTIKKASQIVVMENHTMEDAGTHEELMARCETYKNLISRQSMGAEEN